MDPDENYSGFDAGERWLWDQELRTDPGYAEWVEYIEATSSQRQEMNDGTECI